MQTYTPVPSYPITAALSASGVTVTRVPRWTVPSRTRHGKDHTVTEHEGQLWCSCEAGQYGKTCWHRDWVRDSRAGKPRMGIVAPAAPAQRVAHLPADDLFSDGGRAVTRGVTQLRAVAS